MYINERENGKQHLDMGEGDFLVWGGEKAHFSKSCLRKLSLQI